MSNGEHLRKSALTLVLILGVAAVLMLAVLLVQRWKTAPAEPAYHSGPHILVLLPTIEEGREDFRQMADALSDQYDLRIEVMDLATVSAQKQMLSIVPETDVDAVLL